MAGSLRLPRKRLDEVDEATAAALTGYGSTTLRNWRHEGAERLPNRKFGGLIVYRLADLAAFLASE